MLKFVLEHIKTLNHIKEYMIHTVYDRNKILTNEELKF